MPYADMKAHTGATNQVRVAVLGEVFTTIV